MNLGNAVNFITQAGKAMKAFGEAAMKISKDIDMVANQIANGADKIGGRWTRVNDVAFKTARTMALSRAEAVKYNKALFESTRAIASQFGITYRELDNFQKTYAESIGRNVVLTIQQKEQMAALSKIAGPQAEQLVNEFDKLGVGITRATAYTGRLQERAKALGVSPAKATKIMADNLKLAASYSFKNGVNDIEKMAFKAAGLRMDMSAIMSASEKFADIEGAISTSANIQMLGGSFAREFSNPMGAMYESMADPKAFTERIERTIAGKGTYNAKTGVVEFDPVTMRMMREMAKQLGMSVDQITNPAMAKIQNEKVDEELRAAGKWNEFSKESREAIRNLSRTNFDEEKGKHYITYLGEDGTTKKSYLDELTEDQLKIAQDRQMTEENLFGDVQEIKDILKRTLDRGRDTTSTKEKERGISDLWNTGIVGGYIQDFYMGTVGKLYNSFGNWLGEFFGGGKYAQGGIAKPIHAEFGAMVPGDSYSGDKVPAMVNSGEMILNPMQQKSMFNLISGLALTGGAAYGIGKLGGAVGVKGLGSTALLATALGGGDPSMKTFVEAYFLKKFIKNMLPLKDSINGVGKAAEGATKSTSLFKQNWKTLTDTLSKDLGTITKSMSERWNSFARRITIPTRRYFTSGNIGKATRAISRASNSIGNSISSGLGTLKSSKYAIKASKLYKGIATDTRILGGLGKQWLSERTQGIRGRYDNFKLQSSLFKQQVLKPKTQQYRQLVKNLFNDGSKAQASKLASRLQTPEVAMTGRNTGVVKEVAKGSSAISNAVGKGSRLLSNVGKVGNVAGKFVKPLAAAMAIGNIASETSAASSQYDAKIEEINKSGMSELDKARAKDMATKQKNTAIGGSVGKNSGMAIGGLAGAAKGAALGAVLGPVGMIAGGLIGGAIGGFAGDKLGGMLGKGVGSLFGGSKEKEFKEEQEKRLGLKEGGKEVVKSNDDIVKILTSIDGKLSLISSKKSTIGLKEIAKPSLPKIGAGVVGGAFGTAKGIALGSALGPLGMIAGGLIGGFAGNKIGGLIDGIIPKGKTTDGYKSPIEKMREISFGITPSISARPSKSNISIEPLSTSVKAIPDNSSFLRVRPLKEESASNSSINSIGKTDINLNVSGTIKLEGGGKSVDFDLESIINNEGFKRQLTEIIQKEANFMVNAGKERKEYDTGRNKRV